MLHRRAIKFAANTVVRGHAHVAVVAGHAYLDEFMALERSIDFTQHRRGQAGIANQYHWIEMMGAGFQGFAFERGIMRTWNFLSTEGEFKAWNAVSKGT